MMAKTQKRIRPSFTVSEQQGNTLGDLRPGQKLNVIVNARVVEKTKNFSVLRVDYVYLKPTRRTY